MPSVPTVMNMYGTSLGMAVPSKSLTTGLTLEWCQILWIVEMAVAPCKVDTETKLLLLILVLRLELNWLKVKWHKIKKKLIVSHFVWEITNITLKVCAFIFHYNSTYISIKYKAFWIKKIFHFLLSASAASTVRFINLK